MFIKKRTWSYTCQSSVTIYFIIVNFTMHNIYLNQSLKSYKGILNSLHDIQMKVSKCIWKSEIHFEMHQSIRLMD